MNEQKQEQKMGLIRNFLRNAVRDDDIFWANEIAANFISCLVLLLIMGGILLSMILAMTGSLRLASRSFYILCFVNLLQMGVTIFLNGFYKGARKWMKYLLMLSVCLSVAGACFVLGYRTAMIMTLPVIVSTRYMDRRFTLGIAGIAGVLLLLSAAGFVLSSTDFDYNVVVFTEGTVIRGGGMLRDMPVEYGKILVPDTLRNLLLQEMLPNLLQYVVISVVCVELAGLGHRTVLEQHRVSRQFARVDTELSTAAAIQAHILPQTGEENENVRVMAVMDPARQVGGDFYDYFMIDDHTLGFLAADVSGKGIPASLFMMIAKALLKDHALLGHAPEQVFMEVNDRLCEGNEMELFVTCWMGYLDLRSGVLRFANAGHNPPVLLRKGGKPEYLRSKADFVLAGVEGFVYHGNELTLQPGDRIFLYTDGVTEASDRQDELFGESRLLQFFKEKGTLPGAELLKQLRKRVDEHSNGAEQADDITMLVMDLFRLMETESKTERKDG